jgi:hypothetical protein
LRSGLVVLALLGLLVQVRTALTIAGERENQTWDLLRLTLLTPESLVRGKLWGALDALFPLLTAGLVPFLLVACRIGVLAVLAVVAVWLAGWPILYALAACGVRCSARTRTSWWGLLSCLWWSHVVFVLRVAPLALLGFVGVGVLLYPVAAFALGPSTLPVLAPLVFLAVTAVCCFGLAESLILEAARDLTWPDGKA